MIDFPYGALRRWPDMESPELVAADAADRLLVSTAEAELSAVGDYGAPVAVIGDNYGAVTLGLLAGGVNCVRVHQDSAAGERALLNNADLVGQVVHPSIAEFALVPELATGAELVVIRLPKSLDQLDEWAALVAAHAADDVTVLAGGRDKYMTSTMNEVLARYFDEVSTGRGVQKSRVITARRPRRDSARAALVALPKRVTVVVGGGTDGQASNGSVELEICAFGGVFAGASLDIGTRALLDVLDRVPGQQAQRIIDFGCGTGVLATQLARLRPTATIVATDQSLAAVRSAQATVTANGVTENVTVIRDDGLASQSDESADLIVFNPPFHSGAAVHADTSLRLFAEAGRVLKPGGELWVVANRHLSYKAALRRLVGSTRMISQTTKFVVTASIKDGGRADAAKRIHRRENSRNGLPNERRVG